MEKVKFNMVLYLHNFVIKEKKYKEFQDWVKANEENLAALGKKMGMKYRGTYYYAMGTGAHINADGCMMREFSKYGDIDTEPTIFTDPLNEKLEREESELLVSMPMSVLLLRPVGEALIYQGT